MRDTHNKNLLYTRGDRRESVCEREREKTLQTNGYGNSNNAALTTILNLMVRSLRMRALSTGSSFPTSAFSMSASQPSVTSPSSTSAASLAFATPNTYGSPYISTLQLVNHKQNRAVTILTKMV